MPAESPYEVVVLVASWVFVTAACSIVVRFDERRLDEASLERAWPPASRDSALIGLALLGSPLLALFGVVFHFTRTRRGREAYRVLVGFGLGVACVLGILLGNAAVVIGLATAFGLPLE